MKYLNPDLHCHSIVSDGTLTPGELAVRAKDRGVDLWALTDHDELRGQHSARAAAAAIGLPYLTGIEISVTFAGQTVHIVGLGVDPDHPELIAGVEQTRCGRERRARQMSEGLAAAGIQGAYEGALRYVSNPDLISRTHFARYLVEAGVCADTAQVFKRYLTPGNPGFVEHCWAGLREAVQWIVAAGGLAVIAHPGRYKFTANEEYALFTEFKSHGGQGVEVVTSSHTQVEYGKYADMAGEFDLLASRGSDFHAPQESRCDLGSLPYLPGQLKPVWEALESRIRHA